MKRAIMMMAALAVTVLIVIASLLIPKQMMIRTDRKVDGVVKTADKVYYTGTLDTYNGENDFYTRLMLVTGKWESKQTLLGAEVYSEKDAMDYVSRISLRYWLDDEVHDLPGFMGYGNAIRTVCNLTEFELMPQLLNLYYESWRFQSADVYRYTDAFFRKYRSDVALMQFTNDSWASAELLVDVETGDFIGLRAWYDYNTLERMIEHMDEGWQAAENGTVQEEVPEDMREGERPEAAETTAEDKTGEEGDGENETEVIFRDPAFIKMWRLLFLTGEAKTAEDGSRSFGPFAETRPEKQAMNASVETFMERINFSEVTPVTDPGELEQIAGVPNISDDWKLAYEGSLGYAPAGQQPMTYAYVVTENSSKKRFYFVISSRKGSFEVYFSPMTEKTAGNSLTDQ